jgi:hypothetical protein
MPNANIVSAKWSIRNWTVAFVLLGTLASAFYAFLPRFSARLHSPMVIAYDGRGLGDVAVSVSRREGVEVPKYGVAEVTLAAAETYPNPYLLMPGDNETPGFVTGAFIGPSGQRIVMDGFWDGGSTWNVRMAPTEVGTWAYTTSSADSGLNGRTGRFACIPSASKGFIRVDPDHPHHFRWEDGTPFYWVADGTFIAHFSGPPAQGPRVDDGSFRSQRSIRVNQGFTATHWGFYGFGKPSFRNRNQQNEGGPPFIDYDPDRLNPFYHQYGDHRVKILHDLGVNSQFQLGWPDQSILRIGHTRLKRYWRYLIARYAAYNISYNLFGEVQEFGSSYLSLAIDYAELTRRWDPYQHLLSTHTLNATLERVFLAQPWLDFIILQQPTEATSEYLAYNKPVINAEYGGYDGDNVPGGSGADPDAIRSMIWEIRMRGGYFVYELWGKGGLHSRGARYVSINNRFFRDRTRFRLLEYHPELFAGQPGLANPGQEYITYQRGGGNIAVDLSTTTQMLSVEWLNPRTGKIIEISPVSGGMVRTFTALDTSDWVLHIYASDQISTLARDSTRPFDSGPPSMQRRYSSN